MTKTIYSVKEYLGQFPPSTRQMLIQMRSNILELAPDAEEHIAYSMPAYRLNGVLLYFAGYKNHIGFYASGTAIEHFKSKLSDFKWAKGWVQFPLGKPLPVDLITEIVLYRINENEAKALLKKPTKQTKPCKPYKPS